MGKLPSRKKWREDGEELDANDLINNCRRSCFAVGEFFSMVSFFAVEKLPKPVLLELANFFCLVVISCSFQILHKFSDLAVSVRLHPI